MSRGSSSAAAYIRAMVMAYLIRVCGTIRASFLVLGFKFLSLGYRNFAYRLWDTNPRESHRVGRERMKNLNGID